MSILEQVKKLREKTGAGVVDVKRALDDANGDEQKAIDILRKRGQDKAVKSSVRDAKEGIVGYYVHSNGKIASMVKLLCETDFVARNEEFRNLAKDIAMHIAAMNPRYLKPEHVSDDEVTHEKEIWTEQLKSENKPDSIIPSILAGKEKKFRSECALYTQSFVKNPDITIQDLLVEKVAKIGENIQIGDFIRYEL